MKNILSVICLFLCMHGQLHAKAPQWSWLEPAGGENLDVAKAIAIDNNGNILVTGYFQGTSFFQDTELESKGSNDIFIAKYDNNFKLQWAHSAGGSMFDAGHGIAVDDSGNCYITGFFRDAATFGDSLFSGYGSANIYLAKYDTDGNFQWMRNAGGSATNAGQDVSIDHNGDILVSGFFQATVSFSDTMITGNASINIFVAKYNNGGHLQWVRQAGGDSDDAANGIAVDANNNVLVSGRISGTSVFDDTTLSNSTQNDIFIAKYDADGNFQWVEEAGSQAVDMATKVTSDASGNIYITGYFTGLATFADTSLTAYGEGDVFVSKYDPAGSLLWVRQFRASDGAVGSDLVVDDSGNIILTGYYSDTLTIANHSIINEGMTDVFVASLNSEGQLMWLQTGGGTDSETGDGIALFGEDIFICGYFRGDAIFGDLTESSSGFFEVYTAKLGSPVNYIEQLHTAPATLELKQNYPNPFNPVTTIEYIVRAIHESPQHVNLSIYTLLGQKITTLVDSKQSSGNYKVVFDGQELVTGIYIYKLQSSDFVQSRKMLLLK